MSLLGAAAVLQVKDWGGGILCLLQNSRGLQPYICLISGRSDFAAIIIHGVLLSMKYCWGRRKGVDERAFELFKMIRVFFCLLICRTDTTWANERTALPWRLWHSIRRSKGCWHHRPGRRCHKPHQHQTSSQSQGTLREAERSVRTFSYATCM